MEEAGVGIGRQEQLRATEGNTSKRGNHVGIRHYAFWFLPLYRCWLSSNSSQSSRAD